MSCEVCKVKFTSREPTLSCDGYCGNQFHPNCHNISSDVLKLLKKIPGVSWSCDNCSAISKKPNILKEIFEEKVNSVVKGFESMLIKVKQDLTKIADDKLDELNSVIKNQITQLIENKFNEKSTSTSVPSKSKNAATNLYSTVLKSKSAIILKPKNPSQKNHETKTDVLRSINPVDSELNISSVKNIREGGIVVGCSNEREVTKFKSLAHSKLSVNYEIKDVRSVSPRIRVVGMSEKLDDDVLEKYIRCQNKTVFQLDDSECIVLKNWPTKKNQHIFQAVLQVDVNAYNSIMSQGNGKLIVGFDICDVYDSIPLKRCFKCNGYNHYSNTCRSDKLSCPRCAEEHEVKDCIASEHNLKCINCLKFNVKHKDHTIDVKHAVWDSKCHVFCKYIEDFKSSMYVA